MSINQDYRGDLPDFEVISPQVDAKERIDELKEMARRVLMTTSDTKMTLKLVDTIQRLNIGYYFREDISEILEKLKQSLSHDELHIAALCFRLLRQNGIPADSEVFRKFIDTNGEFIKSTSDDIEGLLSLYEASYLGSNEEILLSHVKEISTRELNKCVTKISPKLSKKVLQALELPIHLRMEILEARRYIEEYGLEDDHNPILLELAKLNYNHVQSLFQTELVEVARWWNHLGVARKFGFVRDRHVESFLWAVGVLPDPKYSSTRIEMAKNTSILLMGHE
nr:probable terpene synthase 11 [Tanacetum cinerariifolium]